MTTVTIKFGEIREIWEYSCEVHYCCQAVGIPSNNKSEFRPYHQIYETLYFPKTISLLHAAAKVL